MRDISTKIWALTALLGLVFAIVPATGPVLAAAPVRSTISPTDGSSSVAVTTDLVITFDQAVVVGTGNITINKFHGGAVQTIDITSDKVSGWSTTAITINIADLDAGTDYYVNYPSTAFKNSLNEFALAITNNTTWNFTTADAPWSGAGTELSPWQISSCNQLLSIDGKADYLNDFFIISNDINCTGTNVYPMKHGTGYFSGSLNGNNKTISGLSINCTTTHCGLFAQMSTTATVYDLVFSAPAVSSSTSHVGVIAGQSSTSSTRTTAQLKNIRILGGSVSGANYTASIVGYALNGVTEDVQSSASVSGADYTGGIFGQMGSSITCTSTSNLTRLSDAQFSGPIGGKSRVGGIVGSFTTTSSEDVCGVFNSTNSGNITATTSCSNVGGVVGSISKGTVHNSSNSGSIAASDCPSTGGVIGGMSGAMSAGASTSSHVSNSWNSGSVSGKHYIGGVVGYCDYGYSTLTRVFNIGSVTSSGGQVGGIIGVSTCVIVDSFSHATVTSTSTAGGAIGDGGGVGGSVVEVQRVYSASNKGFLGRRDTSLLSGALCENSFWDTTLASTTPGNCATSTSPAGKTTSEMKTQATFTGWDFVNYWAINATINGGYPYLKDVGVSALSRSDTTAPTAQTLLPADDATGVALDANLVVTFSENVTAVSSKYIRICTGTASCTGSTVSGDVVQVVEATNAAVTISTNQVTINPATDLSPYTTYYISIDSGAFRDAASNDYAGLSAGSSWNFDTGARTALVHLRAGDYTAASPSWTNQGSLTTSANIATATGGMTKTTINGADAVVFAGKESINSDRVSGTIGSTAALNEVTVEMWLYMDASSAGSMYFSWEQPAGSANYNVYQRNDRLGFNTFRSENLGFNAASLYGSWRHIVFVMSDSTSTASNQKIFVNGVSQALTCDPAGTAPNACTDTSDRRNFASNGNFQLMDNSRSSDTWNASGKIGMFRIFNTSISESEALANFNATKASYPVAVTYAAGSGTGSAPSSPTTAVYGSTFTTPANTYTRTGFNFAGWSDGTNTYAAGATYPASGTVTGNITLTATWTADTTTTPPAPAPTTTVAPQTTTTTTTTVARTRTLSITGAAASYPVLAIGPSLLATPSSGGGVVTWTTNTPDICSALNVTGLSATSASNTVFRVGYLNSAGTCTMSASIAATDTHDAATASVSFEVTKLIARVGIKVGGKINNTPLRAASTWSSVEGETISFWATVSMPFGTKKLVTEANDDVRFVNLTPSVCSLSEPTKEPFGKRAYATFLSSGVCEVDLLLPTNSQRTRAVPTSTAKATLTAATRTLSFPQSTTIDTIDPTDFDGMTIAARVSAGASEGEISHASSTTSVCTIDRVSGELTVLAAGVCTVYASVPATINYSAAAATPLSFTVSIKPVVAPTTTTTPAPPTTLKGPGASLAPFSPSTTTPTVKVMVDSQIVINSDATEFVITADSISSIARNINFTTGLVRVRTSGGTWSSHNIENLTDIRLPVNATSSALEIEFIANGAEPIKYSVPLSGRQGGTSWVQLALVFFGGLGAMWMFIFIMRRRRKGDRLPPPPPPQLI